MESKFLAIGKSDIIKSIGVAILGTLLTTIVPVVGPILAALKAGVIPALPAAGIVQEIALKSMGTGLETAGVYIAHKFLSDESGSPLGGMLNKYMVGVKADDTATK
jgi:hypothetical protein